MNTVIGGTVLSASLDEGICTFSYSGGWNVPAPLTITLNPLFDCFIIPLFAYVLYPFLERCFKYCVCAELCVCVFLTFPTSRVTPLRKMAAGHVFTMASLVTAGVVELFIAQNAVCSVSVWWIVPQYFLVSVAEILLSVTVYELAYSQAPKSMKGLVTGCMFASIAVGNGLLAALQTIKVSLFVFDLVFAEKLMEGKSHDHKLCVCWLDRSRVCSVCGDCRQLSISCGRWRRRQNK